MGTDPSVIHRREGCISLDLGMHAGTDDQIDQSGLIHGLSIDVPAAGDPDGLFHIGRFGDLDRFIYRGCDPHTIIAIIRHRAREHDIEPIGEWLIERVKGLSAHNHGTPTRRSHEMSQIRRQVPGQVPICPDHTIVSTGDNHGNGMRRVKCSEIKWVWCVGHTHRIRQSIVGVGFGPLGVGRVMQIDEDPIVIGGF